MPVQEIKTILSTPGIKQNTVWHLEVIFSSSVVITDKINLASSGKIAYKPTLHKYYLLLRIQRRLPKKPLHKLPKHNTIHPRTLTNMIKTLSSLTLPSPMLSEALTGSRCWLTAWMCLIINRAAGAAVEGLWWQELQPRCWPLPSCLPKCHLNEIGPRSSGIRHCIITYSKTLIEHFIKRLALRFCQAGHHRERDIFAYACVPLCMCNPDFKGYPACIVLFLFVLHCVQPLLVNWKGGTWFWWHFCDWIEKNICLILQLGDKVTLSAIRVSWVDIFPALRATHN